MGCKYPFEKDRKKIPSISIFAVVLLFIRETADSSYGCGARTSGVDDIILELTRYPAGAVSSSHNDMAAAEFALPGRLSAVALEPLRTRTAHVVQFRSIAAVHQGARNGAENSQEIHPRDSPHCTPSPNFLTVTFDQQKEVVGR
jgi:hypothetical protein